VYSASGWDAVHWGAGFEGSIADRSRFLVKLRGIQNAKCRASKPFANLKKSADFRQATTRRRTWRFLPSSNTDRLQLQGSATDYQLRKVNGNTPIRLGGIVTGVVGLDLNNGSQFQLG